MTPQTSVMYAAAVLAGHEPELHLLLNGMNLVPGIVNPSNSTLPFRSLTHLHFARLLIVTELAASDRANYHLATTGLPNYLVLLGEIDGDEDAFRTQLLSCAEAGLRQLFSHCVGFNDQTSLGDWLRRARVAPAAAYVNWTGRTVQQVAEEEELRRQIEVFVDSNAVLLRGLSPLETRAAIVGFVREERMKGRIILTPSEPTPWLWQLTDFAHLLAIPLILIVLSPLLLIYLPFFLVRLRAWERNDPPIAPPVDPAQESALAALENHEVTNQFHVFGSIKPGRVRWWSTRFFLWIVNYTARHIYNRGGLGRVSTIHFARWVPFDQGQRMLFSSVYDGSLESYMDDFINKVGFGLNLTFSNGIGYPRTRWLLFDGCSDEQVFKRVLRRHQLPTEVWYNAHPGLTAANKHRNSMIRAGVELASMTEAEVLAWLALL